MSFKKGQKVKFTDFEGGGLILEILPNGFYLLLADEGIEMKVHKKEIVPLFNPFASLPVFRKESDQAPVRKIETQVQSSEPDWSQTGKPKIKKEKTKAKDLDAELQAKKASDLIASKYEEEKKNLDLDTWQNPNKKTIKKEKSGSPIPAQIPIKAVDLKPENKKKMSAKREYIPEIDLHIDDQKAEFLRLNVDERLQYQLRLFHIKLEEFIARKQRKFVVIHGVGEGILRAEIRSILAAYPQTYFTDADRKRYGNGATLVEIRY